jgi:hypothetical protein
MRLSARNFIVSILVLALALMPAICCCIGVQDNAMAATAPETNMVDCHREAMAPSTSHQHSDHSDDTPDIGCGDCAQLTAGEGSSIDRIVQITVFELEPFIGGDSFVAPALSFIQIKNGARPYRGVSSIVRDTLVSLFVLLLN